MKKGGKDKVEEVEEKEEEAEGKRTPNKGRRKRHVERERETVCINMW